MKYLDQAWKDWLGEVVETKGALEKYIQTPKGAEEAVVWLAVMFSFCAIDALWATWNLWHLLLGSIL